MKIALITGASTGLGISIATQLAKEDFKVYATMRNLKKRDLLDEAIKASGKDIKVLQLDVQDQKSVKGCVEAIVKKEGRIDLLINNAGAGMVKTTEHVTDEEVEWMLDVNLKGVIRCTRAVLPYMRKQRDGQIVNISSVGGLVGQPFSDIYCAAKFGVEGYTESLASYVGPAFNIKFSCVEPGGIKSEFANNVLKHLGETGGMPTDEYGPLLEKFVSGAGEEGRAEDVYQTSAEVASVVVDCTKNDNPPLRIRTSTWAEIFCELKTQADPTGNKLVELVRGEMF